MITSFGQYQNLYTTIPNYIKNDNTELSTNNGGLLRIEKVSIPQYQYFRVADDHKKRPCVIICPGGGYRLVSIQHEGTEVAAYFNSIGINAIVLKYRMPNSANQENKSIAPLQDAQQAIYLARTNAKAWGIDPHKIGIMGFSAGGHLASSLATHYMDVVIQNEKKISLKPDFQILLYPVISFGTIAHKGSKDNLLGVNASEKDIHYFSNETQIDKHSPIAFIVHAKDDKTVPVANSTNYYDSLLAHHVKAEIYLYEAGGHGFGMTNKTSEVYWPSLMKNWLQQNKVIQ
jgi:acetyl esterase/lipase